MITSPTKRPHLSPYNNIEQSPLKTSLKRIASLKRQSQSIQLLPYNPSAYRNINQNNFRRSMIKPPQTIKQQELISRKGIEQNRSVETIRKFQIKDQGVYQHLIMLNQRLREERLREQLKVLRQKNADQHKDNICFKYVPWIVFALLALGLMALAGFLIYEKLKNKDNSIQLFGKVSNNLSSNSQSQNKNETISTAQKPLSIETNLSNIGQNNINLSLKQPITQPSIQKIIEPAIKPIVEPIVQPIIQPIVQPIITPITQPVLKPITQPITQPTIQPIQPHIQIPTTHPTISPTSPHSLPLSIAVISSSPVEAYNNPTPYQYTSPFNQQQYQGAKIQTNSLQGMSVKDVFKSRNQPDYTNYYVLSKDDHFKS